MAMDQVKQIPFISLKYFFCCDFSVMGVMGFSLPTCRQTNSVRF